MYKHKHGPAACKCATVLNSHSCGVTATPHQVLPCRVGIELNNCASNSSTKRWAAALCYGTSYATIGSNEVLAGRRVLVHRSCSLQAADLPTITTTATTRWAHLTMTVPTAID